MQNETKPNYKKIYWAIGIGLLLSIIISLIPRKQKVVIVKDDDIEDDYEEELEEELEEKRARLKKQKEKARARITENSGRNNDQPKPKSDEGAGTSKEDGKSDDNAAVQ